MKRERHLIVFDGDCGFCQWSVARLLRRDRKGQFEAVARLRLPESLRTPELLSRSAGEVVVIQRNGQVLGGASAVFFILSQTGWGLFAQILMLPPWIWVAQAGYRWVARNRLLVSRWLGLNTVCKIDSMR